MEPKEKSSVFHWGVKATLPWKKGVKVITVQEAEEGIHMRKKAKTWFDTGENIGVGGGGVESQQ